jgi:N utilization substance protein A
MNSIELIDSFSEFKEFKNIDRPTMMKVLEDVFRTLLKKMVVLTILILS